MADEKKFLDQAGVQYLWSRLSMEDYPNNETLIAVLNAIDQTKADKEEVDKQIAVMNDRVVATDDGELTNVLPDMFGGHTPDEYMLKAEMPEVEKSDWSVNDENDAAYIKNRTHWTDDDGTVHKIDEKYLPDVGVRSWNDLTDKPFGDNADGTVKQMSGKYVEGMGYAEVTKSYSDTLTWDGVLSDDDIIKTIGGYTLGYHRVSDEVPSLEQLSAGGICTVYQESEFKAIEFTSDEVEDRSSEGAITAGVVAVICRDNVTIDGATFPKAGIYFMSAPDVYISGFKLNGYQFEVETEAVHPIDMKYFPELNYIKTVNGSVPDENGNVEIEVDKVVKTVNGSVPDENGNVEIEVDKVVKGNYTLQSGVSKYTEYGFGIYYDNEQQAYYGPGSMQLHNLYWSGHQLKLGDDENYVNIYPSARSSSSDASLTISHHNESTQAADKVIIYSNGNIVISNGVMKLGYNYSPTIIRNVKTPEQALDAVNKEYVDAKVSDKELILTSSTEGSTKRFKITVNDAGVITATEIAE